jgi:predicted  nucleic acid-binding Zn-ribbon protein
MDPDTSKKVNDLLSLMEDISSDVDTQTELEKLLLRLQRLEETVNELEKRFELFENAYLEKQQQIKSITDEIKSMFSEEV